MTYLILASDLIVAHMQFAVWLQAYVCRHVYNLCYKFFPYVLFQR